MAKNMFKTTATVHLENTSDAGNWNSFLELGKQQDHFKSAYIDKIRITAIQSEQLNSAVAVGTDPTGPMFVPAMFAVSNKTSLDDSTPSNNSPYIIAAGAIRGGGGSVTLSVKRRIVVNEMDSESGEAMLRLFIKNPSLDKLLIGGGDCKFYLIIETWGRWHRSVAL